MYAVIEENHGLIAVTQNPYTIIEWCLSNDWLSLTDECETENGSLKELWEFTPYTLDEDDPEVSIIDHFKHVSYGELKDVLGYFGIYFHPVQEIR